MTIWFHQTDGESAAILAKNAGMLESEIERHQAAQRRSADARVLRIGKRAVFAIDEGFYLFQQKFCVAIGAAASEFWDVGRRVLADARLGVVHPDDDERLDGTRLNAIIRGLADVPILSRNERGGAVKEVLAIVKIEDGKMAPRLVAVAGRRVNDKVALIAKKSRAKLFVFAKLSRTHGVMVTRRSFASTCCPEATRSFATRPEIGA